MEEELKQLKELNEGLQQKLASAEEMYDMAVENHSKVTAESNEKVLAYKTKKITSHYSVTLHPLCSVLIWSSG